MTVSKEIELPQPFENMGAKLVNMVASKTGDVAGDGTTTATVLAEAIYTEGLKYVTAGVNPGADPARHHQGRRSRRRGDHRSISKKVKGKDDYKQRRHHLAPTAMSTSAS